MDDPKSCKTAWDVIRDVARLRHLSLRTEEAYVIWIRRFWIHHHKKNLRTLDAEAIRSFLTHLAVERKVSASSQNQALCAILFLYRDVLKIELPFIEGIEKAKQKRKLPVVFTPAEARTVLRLLTGIHRLMASLLYGSGLRLVECMRLRVKDIDFGLHQITIRDGKGEKDRITMLPKSLEQPLRQHLKKVHLTHEGDSIISVGFGTNGNKRLEKTV
jgi:site-specific recombinase XerD